MFSTCNCDRVDRHKEIYLQPQVKMNRKKKKKLHYRLDGLLGPLYDLKGTLANNLRIVLQIVWAQCWLGTITVNPASNLQYAKIEVGACLLPRE